MKKLFAALFTLLPAAVIAQPAGYYNSASGKSGEALRRALYNVIKGHNDVGYSGLWTAYYTTDAKPNGRLATLYSDKPGSAPPYEFTIGADQNSGGSASAEGASYNREHTWPRTFFGGAVPPMNSDLWLVYPVDAYINGQRQTFPYGRVASPSKIFLNGTRIGPQAAAGAPSGTAFEPIDSFKGDIARSYFYISTRYYGDSAQFSDWAMAFNSRLKPWAIQMLLEWHRLDPVSKKEKDRNEAVYALQGNRNPFVDDARFAECIWSGNCAGLSVPELAKASIRILPNPASGRVTIDWAALSPDEVLAVDVVNMQGQVVYQVQKNGAFRTTLDVASWTRGLYGIHLRNATSGRVIQKLMLQ